MLAFHFGVAVSGAVASAGSMAGAEVFPYSVYFFYTIDNPIFDSQIKAGSATLVAVAISIILALLVSKFIKQRMRPVLRAPFYAFHWLVIIAVAMLAVSNFEFSGPIRRILQYVIFLGLLPISNAPLDWLSLGLTRWLLRIGRARGLFGWQVAMSFVDLACALLIMVVLAGLTSAMMALINGVGDGPVLALEPLFEGFRDKPVDSRNLWIYLMLFSTLLPTLVHLLAGLAALSLTLTRNVLSAVTDAKAFEKSARGEDIQKDNMLRFWYPFLGALGTTALVFLGTTLWWFLPWLAVPF